MFRSLNYNQVGRMGLFENVFLVFAALFIFSIPFVLAGATDVGQTLTADGSGYGAGLTLLNIGNPASATFSCTNVKIYMVAGGSTDNVKVGSFFGADATWENRDYAELGSIATGEEVEVTGLSIDFQSGDVIGMFDTGGYQPIEADVTGGDDVRYLAGDQFGAGEQSSYTRLANDALYLYCEVVAADTCTCPGLNQNWEINMSDNCQVDSACDLGTGTLSFVGTGYVNLNATIDSTNLGDPGSGGVVWVQDSCVLTVD